VEYREPGGANRGPTDGDSMKKDQEFARRIKALYGKRGPDAGDLRSEELPVMFDVFLGKTYDKRRKVEIARVQENVHNKQERLANKFHAGNLNAEEYFESLNSLVGEAFAKCRRILGPNDFKRLFGATYTKEKDFVDRSAFLESQTELGATYTKEKDFVDRSAFLESQTEHRRWQVTVYYHDGEKFARVYTDRAKAAKFAERKKKSAVVKATRVMQVI